MSQIKISKKKLCHKHGFYITERCDKCISDSNKKYNDHSRNMGNQNVYQSSRWRKLRQEAIVRDGFQCQECGEMVGIKPRDHVVDHIVEVNDNRGLAFELSNLTLLCAGCHNKKRCE